MLVQYIYKIFIKCVKEPKAIAIQMIFIQFYDDLLDREERSMKIILNDALYIYTKNCKVSLA